MFVSQLKTQKTLWKQQVAKSINGIRYKEKVPKSKFTLFREKYPEGIGEIVNMRAVLR